MQHSLTIATLPAAAALALALGLSVAGAADKPAAPASPGATAKVNALLGVAIPEATFNSTMSGGKDPFFPQSNRLAPKTPLLTPAVVTEVNRAHLLTLRGISGPATRRIALINNTTFVAGEAGTVRTVAGTLKIRVQTVEDKIVTLLIDGDSQPRQLELDDKIPASISIQTSQVEK
jgi:hypothetical protein